MKKRLLSLFLVTVMLFTMMPVNVFAADDDVRGIATIIAKDKEGNPLPGVKFRVNAKPANGDTRTPIGTGVTGENGEVDISIKADAFAFHDGVIFDCDPLTDGYGYDMANSPRVAGEKASDHNIEYFTSEKPDRAAFARLAIGGNADKGFSFTFVCTLTAPAAPEEPVKPTFDVTWRDWNGTELKSVKDVTEEPEAPADPTRAEDDAYTYKFDQWAKSVDNDGNITYTAQYTATPKQHECEDNDGDGFCDDRNCSNCLHDKDNAGYCTIDSCNHPHEGNDACCPLKSRMVYVSYYDNDGEWIRNAGNKIYETGTFGFEKAEESAADKAPTGFTGTVVGWATEPNQEVPTLTSELLGTAYHSTTVQNLVENFNVAVKKDGDKEVLKFYAVYEPADVTVRWLTNDGSEEIMHVTKKYSNALYNGQTFGMQSENLIGKANDKAPTGHHFEGWAFDVNATETADIERNSYTVQALVSEFGVELIEEDGKLFVDVYAVYQPNKYKMIYWGNGGRDEWGSEQKDFSQWPWVYGKETDVAGTNSFKREGYTCLGWAFDKDATTPDITRDTYKINVNFNTLPELEDVASGSKVNLYAVWEANEYEVTFNPGEGGSVDPVTMTVTYDSAYGELPTPTHSFADYKFQGWYLGDKRITEDSIVKTAEAHELVAKWIDQTPPVVDYTVATGDTENDRFVKIIANEPIKQPAGNWSKVNNKGGTQWKMPHLPYGKVYEFVIEDLAGNKSPLTIDLKAPVVVSIEYSTTEPTNQDVTVTLTFDENVVVTTAGWKGSGKVWTKIFAKNADETVAFADTAKYPNSGSTTVSVTNIDKVAPEVSYVVKGATNKPQVIISANEPIQSPAKGWSTVNNMGGTQWKKSIERGNEIEYEIKDLAGNVTKLTVDLKAPEVIDVALDPSELTVDPVVVTITFDEPTKITSADWAPYVPEQRAAVEFAEVWTKTFQENTTETVNFIDAVVYNGNTGSVEVVVDNIRLPLTEDMIQPINPVTYNGNKHKPVVVVDAQGNQLTEGVDYTVVYNKNTDAGTAEYTVTGIGAYLGEVSGTFVINPKPITVHVTAEDQSKPYNGNKQTFETKFTWTIDEIDSNKLNVVYNGAEIAFTDAGGKSLSVDDFAIASTASRDAKNYTATFTLTGGTMTITPLEVDVVVTMPTAEYTYDGTQKSLDVSAFTMIVSNGSTKKLLQYVGEPIVGTDAGEYKFDVNDFVPVKDHAKNFIIKNIKFVGGVLTIKPLMHTVTFDSNSGSKVDSQTVEHGQKATEPADPTRSGHKFRGWTLDGKLYDFNTEVTGDITLEALWSKKSSSSKNDDYKVIIEKTKNGDVESNRTYADKGDIITITVDPDKGYEVDDITVTKKNGDEIKVTKKSASKYTFKMPAADVYVDVDFEKEAAWPFADVDKDDVCYDAVKFMYENGLMAGVGDGTKFAPDMDLSRAMTARIFHTLEENPAAVASNFTDVARNFWYTNAIDWASATGVISGYGNGAFGPNDSVTKEQLAMMLYKYAQSKGYDVSMSAELKQADVSFWAVEAVEWAVEIGVLTENDAGYVVATEAASRADVAEAFMAFLNYYA